MGILIQPELKKCGTYWPRKRNDGFMGFNVAGARKNLRVKNETKT